MSGWARRRLNAYLDGDLEGWERERLERHLADSPELRAELEELRGVLALLHELPEADPPPFLADRVMARIEDGEAEPARLAVWLERLSGWTDSAWAAPLATAVAGLTILALVQGVEVEFTLPLGGDELEIASDVPVQPEPFPEAAPAPVAPAPEVRPPAPASLVQAEPAPPPPSAAPTEPEGQALAASDDDFVCASDAVDTPDCRRWQSHMLGLAINDPVAFVRALDEMPPSARARSLDHLRMRASSTGSADALIAGLRRSPDQRAKSLVPHFESPIIPASSQR